MHDKDATPIEAIEFESLQTKKQDEQLSRRSLSQYVFWFALLFLLACAFVVFIYLPKYINEQTIDDQYGADTEVDLPPAEELDAIKEEIFSPPEAIEELSPEELANLKQQAEELLLQIIEKQNYLESVAIKKWAAQEFKSALALGTKGDEYFRMLDYKNAIEVYSDTIKALNDLEKAIAPTLANNLEKGELALSKAEKDTAIHHFEIAKLIDENNIQAINGFTRAATIVELFSLLEKGGRLEAANRLSDAKIIYTQAVELDPLSTEAKHALDRVTNRLNKLQFTHLMNQGHSSLKLRQYADAQSAFNAALALEPNSDKPKQGLASVKKAIRDEKIYALFSEAKHFESVQDWSNAANAYQQILLIKSNETNAEQGLHRNKQLESIFLRLNEHINNSLRLGSQSFAKEAKQLLVEVSLLEAPGSKIEQAALTLKKLLIDANQPITITLQSDNQTDIAIYKVGKFGKFDSRKIDLKPGKYTVVGSRPGFRDIRKVITVLTDMRETTILVRCEEPI